MGGWDAALAQMLGLWVRRRFNKTKKQKVLRIILSGLLFPVIAVLYQRDRPPINISF